MNPSEMQPMEGEIQEEEIISSPKVIVPKNKPGIKLNFSQILEKTIIAVKSTKLKTVFILFFIFIIVSVGLIIVSSQKGSHTDTFPEIEIATPQPQQIIINSQTKEIEDNLDIYDKKVDSLGNNLSSYGPPQIDLNVNF